MERAHRYRRPLYRALIADTVLSLATLAALTQVDLPLPWWAEIAVGAALVAAVLWLVRLPLGRWRLAHERRWELSTQTTRGWAVDRAKALAVGGATTVLSVAPLLALAHLWPHSWVWPAALGAALLVVLVSFVAPVVLEPIFNRFAPLADEQLAARLRGLADRAGAPVRQVLVADASRRTRTQNAYVSGFGRTRRVVLWDTLLEAPGPELELVVAHELAHRRMRHVLKATLLGAAGAAAFVVVLWLVRPHPTAHDTALVLLLGGLLEVLALPFGSALSRRWERAADRFSLELTGDRPAYLGLHRRLATTNLADLDPPKPLYLALFTHPTAPERLAAAELLLDRRHE